MAIQNQEQGATAASAAARRRLTLLYTDLTGSTALSRAVEPEVYRAVLAQLRQIWRAAAQRHQGRLVLAQGDGALLVFGIDGLTEDEGRRAADAALAVHAEVAQLRPSGVPAAFLPLQMHTGIHAGNLLLAAGDIELGLFDLSGDVLNLAAALSKQARPGQILVTLPSLGPHANCFVLDTVPASDSLSGLALADMQPALRQVLGPGQATRRFEATAQRGLTPFIGRADLLARLRAHVAADAAAGAAGRCLVLQGGPGLGKTRLLEELLHPPAGMPGAAALLLGGCESYLGAQALQPFVQMLRAWFQRSAAPHLPPSVDGSAAATHLQACAEAVRTLAGAGGAAAPGRLDAASGVVGDLQRFFAALAATQPCVLLIDDWQWADDASRQLLLALLQAEPGPRVLLAARPSEDGAPWVAGAVQLDLSPFGHGETHTAVQRLLDRPDPFLVARIHDYAGGVPLFIEELCHSVSADQVLRLIDGGRANQSWLSTLVVSRLERLPADQAAVLRAAAVVGNVVPLPLLAAACGQAPSQATLQALAEADFLRSDAQGGGLRFKHGITRDAVYGAIGLQERMALHRRLEAALLAAADQPGREDAHEALAHHSRGAGHWELAARHAEHAGDQAMAAFALDRARTLYLSAMDALDRLAPGGRSSSVHWSLLANKLGMTCIFDTLALPDALAIFQRSLALAQAAGDAATLARACYWMGYMSYGHGQPRHGVGHCRQALALATDIGDQRLAAQVEATLGQALAASCDYDAALALMDRALAAKRQHVRAGSSVAVGSAFTLATQASVLADRGAFDAAHAALAQAHALLGESTHPVANSVRNWAVMVLLWQGRWDEARQVADDSVRLAEISRALQPLAISRAAGGYARWMADGDAAGLAQVAEAVHWMEQRRGQFFTSIYYGWLVEGCVAQQRLGDARRHASRLLLRARAGELLGEAVGSRALAWAHMDAGDAAQAMRWWQRAERSAQRRGSVREQALNQLCLARLLRRQGRPGDSRVAAGSAAAALQALGMVWHAGQAAALV
jgi:class 3 adenylate cyclase